MAFCSNCGTKLEDVARFCASCGTPVGGGAPPAPPAAPKPSSGTEKVGNIRKCPACGAEVAAMTAVCAECGHEFSNTQVAGSLQNFVNKLDALEEKKAQISIEEAQQDAGNLKSMLLKNTVLSKSATEIIDKQIIAHIEAFPIPNAKEDILEFVIMAASRIKKISGGSKLGVGFMKYATVGLGKSANAMTENYNKAWKAKCEQAYSKAKIVFGQDNDGLVKVEQVLRTAGIIK